MGKFLASVEHKAYRIARYAIWDHEAALDIVQDSMLKLVEKYSHRPAQEWPPLFYTILNNRIQDVRRRAVREGAGKIVSLFKLTATDEGATEMDLLETAHAASISEGKTEPEIQLRNRQLGAAIDRAITGLSWRQRQVFLLREWQGLNVKDTALVLGCSEGSVKQHHFRAMQGMRKQLAEVWQDD